MALELAQQHLLLAVLQLLVRARGGLEDLLVMSSARHDGVEIDGVPAHLNNGVLFARHLRRGLGFRRMALILHVIAGAIQHIGHSLLSVVVFIGVFVSVP